MSWFLQLVTGSGIAHSIFIIAITIAVGILLGKIKIGGISLGVTLILFTGIALSHFKVLVDPAILNFVKEFGLILFVFSIGMQVGPGFFSSFKKGGVTMNLLATMIVLLGCATAIIIHFVTGEDLVVMTGILCGAVTNTPGLGAAQQTYSDVMGSANPDIALGYAMAYPLGVLGIIGSMVAIRYIFRIKLDRENYKIDQESAKAGGVTTKISVEVHNNAIFGKSIEQLHGLIEKSFVISRMYHSSGRIEIPTSQSVLSEGDKLLIITSSDSVEAITSFIGKSIDMTFDQWLDLDSQLIMKKVVITRSEINGKTLSELKVRSLFGVNITRVTRSGVDLVADGELELQIGDRVLVVGDESSVEGLARYFGNSLKRLREPHLITIFFGIAIGVLFGSIPFMLPGIPQPVKLGLAGGPLIIAILISRFGYKLGFITYTTQSANIMLREVGISLFLAAVGLGAGENFVETLLEGGYKWVGYGFMITVIPLLIVSVLARFIYKQNYFTIIGLIAGSTTDPPALAYSNSISASNYPAVAYATVYPLVMFLRVLTAQLIVLYAL